MEDNEMKNVEFDLDTPIKVIAAFLGSTHTIKGVARQIGISERDLSTALKDSGFTYRERRWIPESFEDPTISKPLRDFLQLKPVFNQRQIEKIVQLIDSRLANGKELIESDLFKAVSDLAPIKKAKVKIKVDKETFKSFEQYCLDHDLNQVEALTLALQNFMKVYK